MRLVARRRDDDALACGEAVGFVIEFANGVKIYHAGDSNVFGDMKIIHDLYAPDIAMLPIGDHYTMSPREAAYACNLLKPKTVIPMHFGTFPVLTGRPGDLQKLVPGVEIASGSLGHGLPIGVGVAHGLLARGLGAHVGRPFRGSRSALYELAPGATFSSGVRMPR